MSDDPGRAKPPLIYFEARSKGGIWRVVQFIYSDGKERTQRRSYYQEPPDGWLDDFGAHCWFIPDEFGSGGFTFFSDPNDIDWCGRVEDGAEGMARLLFTPVFGELVPEKEDGAD